MIQSISKAMHKIILSFSKPMHKIILCYGYNYQFIVGFDLGTFCLPVYCSTDWATLDWLLRWQKNKNIKFSITYRGLLTKSYWIEGLCQIPIYKIMEFIKLKSSIFHCFPDFQTEYRANRFFTCQYMSLNTLLPKSFTRQISEPMAFQLVSKFYYS